MKKLFYILTITTVLISCGQVKQDNGLCQPDEYYVNPDTSLPVYDSFVFGQVVDTISEPIKFDSLGLVKDSIRFDSLMNVD